MKQQNIFLPLGSRGYSLSIAQGVGDGSLKGHYAEVALFNGAGEMVEAGLWYHGLTYDEIDEKCCDDVMPYVSGAELEFVINRAKAWVNKNQ